MIITDILTKNAELYGNEVSLIEVNPEIQERIDKAWKEFDLVEAMPKPIHRSEITWGEFEGNANKLAHHFLSEGVTKGKKVAILMMNCIGWLPIYFGILKTGAVVCPMNFRYSADEIKYCLELSESDVLVFGPEFITRINEVKDKLEEYGAEVAGIRMSDDNNENIEKCIRAFIDEGCDMVVCTDIAELLRLPLEGYYFAAAIEIVMAGLVNGFAPHMRDYLENTLQLDYRDYVNAGLMVFNCESMRRDFTSTQLLEDAAKKQYMIVDQDALNTSCRGRIFKLGVEWNLPTDAPVELQGPCARKSDYIKCAPEDLREQYRQAHENPKVIHYTDKGKPWLLPEEDLADVFWDTARRTPFYETILFRLLDFQTRTKAESIQLPEKPVQYYPQGKLFKRTVKRVVRIFLPYGTKRRAFVKKYYFKLRGWSIE